MFKERHYFTVGLFVLAVAALGGYFVYWLAVAKEPDDMRRYIVQFDGSVRGLTKGSSVQYLGVKVGRVQDIRLNPERPERVEVHIDVKRNTPMRTNTQASVQMQGLTGLAFVSLSQANSEGRPLEYPREGIPEIPSRESQLERLFETVPALVQHVTELTRNVNQLFSEQNVRHVSSMLERADQATQTLQPAMQEMTALLQDTRAAVQHISTAAESLSRTSTRMEPQLQSTIQNIQKTSENMARVTDQIDGLIEENREGINDFVTNGLSEFSLLMHESRNAAQEIQRLTESLQRNPSQLIIPSNIERTEIKP